jgi:hypothetical protein
MRGGRLRRGLGIVASTAIGLSLASNANYLALARPALGGRQSPKPPAAPATPHTVTCSESFGKDSNHLKLAMGFGFKNVTTTDVEAGNGTKVAASVLFPDDPQQRLEVWWTNAASHSGIYLIVIGGKSDWTAPGGLHLGLTLAELEKLNHKSFKLKGFDKSGVATGTDWDGGELASLAGGCNAGLSLRPDPKVSAKIIGALSPNKEYASSNPQMRVAKSTVSEILIGYPADAPATEPAPQSSSPPAAEAAPQSSSIPARPRPFGPLW